MTRLENGPLWTVHKCAFARILGCIAAETHPTPNKQYPVWLLNGTTLEEESISGRKFWGFHTQILVSKIIVYIKI